MQDILRKFEERLERIFEDPVANLLDSHINPAVLADSLLEALEANLLESNDRFSIPNRYTLCLSPDTHTLFSVHEDEIRSSLSEWILENARRRNYLAPELVEIGFKADANLAGDNLVINASHSNILDTTHSLPANPQPPSFPEDAYLIFNEAHIPIDRPILNIGRRRDNQIVINERSVSRTHAQIRARDPHFLLIDLGSTTGTFVNGNQIRQAILQSGDVIMIGGTKLVYFEDAPGLPDETSAIKRVSAADDQERMN